MKVLSSKLSVSRNFRDYYIKELSGSISGEIERVDSINENIIHQWYNLNGDSIDIVVEIFNERAGSDLGTRLYSIPLFSNNEKERIRFSFEGVVLGIIELLESYGVGFTQLGSGLISDWLESDDGKIRCKIWISEDFKFISITRKILIKEETITNENILDRLGL